MAERIDFRFEGRLSDGYLMDFYEASRFQYDAARLMVKLDQFRRTGTFVDRITPENNTRVLLAAQAPGSFILATLAPLAGEMTKTFVSAPISLMWSYVVDRVVKPASDDNIKQALAANQQMSQTFEREIAAGEERNRRTIDLLEDRIARGDQLHDEANLLRERLLSETERRAYLEGQQDLLRQITPDQDARLVSMAAPLMRGMGVALRQSASSLQVTSSLDGTSRRLLFLNKQMANEIETIRIDEESTVILVKIVQYNRETGWGKLRLQGHPGLLSFNVPSDVKARLQAQILQEMNEQDSYIECVFVRSPRGLLKRAIVLSIMNIDDVEAGLIG